MYNPYYKRSLIELHHYSQSYEPTGLQDHISINDVDGEFLRNEIADYEFTGIINKTKIMSFIKKPFVLKNKIAKAITEFIQANVLKYQ